MTDPWTIIGWVARRTVALVAVLYVGIVVFVVARRTVALVAVVRRTRRMLRVTPCAGQVWNQGEARLTITRIAENGRIVLSSGAASWSDTPEQWRERIRDRRIWTVQS